MSRLLPVAAATLLTACAGGADLASNPCQWDRVAQLPSGDAPPDPLPSDTSGELATAIVGLWQHTWIESGSAFLEVSDEDSDLRFSFPDASTFVYCQQVDLLGDEGRSNEAPLTIDGLRLDNGSTGYTVTGWSEDVLVMRNDYFDDKDEFFILERLR